MVDAFGGDPEKQRSMPIQDRTMGKNIPQEVLISLKEKNMNFFARRFYEEFYTNRAIDRTNIQNEAQDLKKGFEEWHSRIVSDFQNPMQIRFGEEIGNLQDLNFEHVVKYPEVELEGIREKIQRSQGLDTTSLNLQQEQWELRRDIAKAALNPQPDTQKSNTPLALPTDKASAV